MSRTVYLPTDLSELLEELAGSDNEVNGVLFYRQVDDDCLVDYLFLTGEGDIASTTPDGERLAVGEKFLKQNPG